MVLKSLWIWIKTHGAGCLLAFDVLQDRLCGVKHWRRAKPALHEHHKIVFKRN